MSEPGPPLMESPSSVRAAWRRIACFALLVAGTQLLAGCLGDEQDRGAPAVRLATGNNQTVDADSIQVEGSVVDPAGVSRASYQLNSGTEQPIQIPAGVEAPFSFSAELVDGDNVIIVNGYDRTGNLGYATLRVRRPPDASPPTITLTNPVDGSSVSVASVTVAGTASDNRSVRRVSVQLNGAAEQVLPVTAGRSVAFSTSLTGLRAGQNSIAVHAYDRAGNRATVARTITLLAPTPTPAPAPDTTAPTVSITQPAAGAALTSTSVGVSAVVADNVAVTRAGWKLNGGVETPMTVSGTSATLNFTVSGLGSGTNSIIVNAYDAAGNVGTALVNVVVQLPSPPPDTAPPTLALSEPTDGSTVNTSSVTVRGSASDAVGVTRVAVQLNGGAEQNASITPGPAVSFSRTVSGLANGTNVIVVNAYDAAGNKASTSLRITYSAPSDTIAPTVTIAAPADGATVNSGTVSASGQASDNLAVTRVTSQVNGGAEVEVAISGGASTSFGATLSGFVAGTNAIKFNAYDAAGNRGSATININYVPPPPPPSGVAFPLRVEAGKRYLVDAAGKPFFVNGDTAWSLLVQLTREQADQYLEDRRARGFTAILVSLLESTYANNPPKNAYGDGPFTTEGDFGTPNERYFAHVDYVANKAAEKGLLLLMTPSYLGCCGDGWLQHMRNNGTTKLTRYGEYLGNRYRTVANILWVNGGDQAPTSASDRALVDAIANGIRGTDSAKLQTFHTGRFSSALQYTSAPWLTVNNIYTDASTVVTQAFGEYGRSTMPFFLIEAQYEEGTGGGSQTMRAQAYQAVLSGAMGHVYGNSPVWYFNAPTWSNPSGITWQQALDSQGARSMKHLAALFAPRSWWTLAPDTNNTLLTGGISSGADRAVAARAADGSFAVAYTPNVRTLVVALGQLVGPRVNARWFDPTSGSYSAVPGSPFLASGSQAFTPPGNNATGYGDWVLVLESTQ